MRRLFKFIYTYILPSLLSGLLLAGIWMLGQRLEPRMQDVFMQWSARSAEDSPVVMVLIDDESILQLSQRFGPLPWSRQSYLEIFQAIQAHDPALIVFDGHFMNLDRPEDQQVFARMQDIPNLLTGLALSDHPMDFLNTSVPDYYRLNLGVVSMWQDSDGVIRSVKPFFQSQISPARIGIFPALSVAAVYDYLALKHPDQSWVLNLSEPRGQEAHLLIHPESQPDQGLSVPLNPDGSMQLRWYKTQSVPNHTYQHSHPIIPVRQLLDDIAAAPSELQGKIVMVGSSSSVYRDYHPSPMALRHLGTDIHATAIDNLLNQASLHPLPPWISWLTIGALFTLVFLLRMRVQKFGHTLLYTIGTMVIYLWLTYYLFDQHGISITIVTAQLFMLVALFTASTFRIINGERELALAEQSLAQLVSPGVYREIRKLRKNNANLLKADGRRLEITSMFVDIRNFTTMAENLPPTEVTEILNEFYSAVVHVVFAHRGTVDKFMGDGILIIFGAPIPSQHHADLAMAAAREIMEATAKLSERWWQEKTLPAEIGISLNSGAAFVGFLGPQNKLEYTAVGDTVNICIRLQQQTKEYNSRIIISEHTVQRLSSPALDLMELGKILLKGREAVLKIYGLIPPDNKASRQDSA